MWIPQLNININSRSAHRIFFIYLTKFKFKYYPNFLCMKIHADTKNLQKYKQIAQKYWFFCHERHHCRRKSLTWEMSTSRMGTCHWREIYMYADFTPTPICILKLASSTNSIISWWLNGNFELHKWWPTYERPSTAQKHHITGTQISWMAHKYTQRQ